MLETPRLPLKFSEPPACLPEPIGGRKPSPEVRRSWAFIPEQRGLKIRLQRELPLKHTFKSCRATDVCVTGLIDKRLGGLLVPSQPSLVALAPR